MLAAAIGWATINRRNGQFASWARCGALCWSPGVTTSRALSAIGTWPCSTMLEGLLWQDRVLDGAPTEVRRSIDDPKCHSCYLPLSL
jgi:hypothetical protein